MRSSAARTLAVWQPGIADKHGSRSYWAPEVIAEEAQGFYSDWWSVGITLVQCANGRHPFMRRWVRAPSDAIEEMPPPPWDEDKVDTKGSYPRGGSNPRL